MKYLMLLLVLSASAGCDDTDADGCPLDCSGHGSCVFTVDLFACECDEGFIAQGLECIDPNASAEPPEDFSCPNPGDVSGPAATRLVGEAWSYRANDRACAPARSELYQFRENGVYSRLLQSRGATQGGTLIYGCWTVAEDAEGVLELTYNQVDAERYNCGVISELDDADCGGALKFDAGYGGFVFQRQLENGETHVLHPVPDGCVWCSDRADCCALPSWVEADGVSLCD